MITTTLRAGGGVGENWHLEVHTHIFTDFLLGKKLCHTRLQLPLPLTQFPLASIETLPPFFYTEQAMRQHLLVYYDKVI